MQYTSNYHLSKPEADDIINPNSRTGYNGNFDTIDTNLKSVSNKADTNENDITTLQGNITTLQSDVTILYNLLVPVGVILTFASNIDPNNIYAGTTWEKIEGKFLLGSSSSYALGSTGGEATHTLTEQEIPSHSHTSKGYIRISDTGGNQNGLISTGQATTEKTNPTGGSQAHNNMPPYEVVNYWKRTA